MHLAKKGPGRGGREVLAFCMYLGYPEFNNLMIIHVDGFSSYSRHTAQAINHNYSASAGLLGQI